MILCLDIEGTLISNATSQIPRPGLYRFLEEVNDLAHEVVIYTTLSELKTRVVLDLLRDEEVIPEWFAFARYIPWSGNKKHLSYAAQQGSVEDHDIYLVDDYEGYIHDQDRDYWIPIHQFDQPYPEDDHELERVLEVVRSIYQREQDYLEWRNALEKRIAESFDVHPLTIKALVGICLDKDGKIPLAMKKVFRGSIPEGQRGIFSAIEKECAEWIDSAKPPNHQQEQDHLDRWRSLKKRLNEKFDMPDKTLSALVTICLNSGGKISNDIRKTFRDRVPEEIFDVIEQEHSIWTNSEGDQ